MTLPFHSLAHFDHHHRWDCVSYYYYYSIPNEYHQVKSALDGCRIKIGGKSSVAVLMLRLPGITDVNSAGVHCIVCCDGNRWRVHAARQVAGWPTNWLIMEKMNVKVSRLVLLGKLIGSVRLNFFARGVKRRWWIDERQQQRRWWWWRCPEDCWLVLLLLMQ